MSFSILPNTAVLCEQGNELLLVKFDLNGEIEFCSVPIGYWSFKDYVSQWIAALYQVCCQHQVSALITSIYDYSQERHIAAWLIYPLSDGTVRFQQHICLAHDIIDSNNMIRSDLLANREIISESGDPISEWTIPLGDILIEFERLSSMNV